MPLLAAVAGRAAAGRPVPFARDNFSGVNGALLQDRAAADSYGWTKHGSATGDAVLFNGRLRGDAGSSLNCLYHHNAAPPHADYDVVADLVLVLDNNLASGGPIGRVAAGANTFYHARYSTNGNNWQLFRFVAGTPQQLGSNAGATLTGGQVYRVVLRMRGTAITMLVDGVAVVGPVTDANIAGPGQAGVRLFDTGGDATGLHVDGFHAIAPAGRGLALARWRDY